MRGDPQARLEHRDFEATPTNAGIRLLPKAGKGEYREPEHTCSNPCAKRIESINQVLQDQLDLERHGGHTIARSGIPLLQPSCMPRSRVRSMAFPSAIGPYGAVAVSDLQQALAREVRLV
ncbi:hypothetical protein ACIBKY_43850 [Nonomuraea sp. NPDC050394]|uniref:hypothetical protein n=1 Tax=Nonomuraea sp. NPDC050394 TaxID=3364363 RepID=UPI0037ACFBAA